MPSRPPIGLIVGLGLLLFVGGNVRPPTVAAQTIPVVRTLAGTGFNDAYRLGLGASGGLEIPFIRDRRFFIGLRSVYHFGSDGELAGFGPAEMPDPTGSVSQFQAGLEIGATWMSSPLFIRTVGGLGLSRVSVELESGESELEGTNNKLQYGPGVLLALPTEGGTFAGLEIRWLKVSDLDSALSVYVTLGRWIR